MLILSTPFMKNAKIHFILNYDLRFTILDFSTKMCKEAKPLSPARTTLD